MYQNNDYLSHSPKNNYLTQVHGGSIMVYNSDLTASQADKKIPIIIKRDGDVCYFDLEPFFENIPELKRQLDHLNDNERDNRVENLGLLHAKCNRKKVNNFDIKIIGLDKLRNNISLLATPQYVSEIKTQADELTEGAINHIINKVTKLELETKLPSNSTDTISYSKTLKSIHYLVIQETVTRGSEMAARRSLDAYCSSYAPWLDEKQGKGNRIIRRRKVEEIGK